MLQERSVFIYKIELMLNNNKIKLVEYLFIQVHLYFF